MESAEALTMVKTLQLAIQLEVDGKKFYQQASQKSGNKLSKDLFKTLAIEEDSHRKKFEEIYEALKGSQDWPDVKPLSGKGKRIESIFTEAIKELGNKIKVAESEVDAIKASMDMEIKTYEFYRSRSEQSTIPLEKQFYQAMAAEERGHHFVLLDAYEYLTDPAGWFVRTEHTLLDGA